MARGAVRAAVRAALRALRDTRGVAAVEMAVAAPLLLTFFCGVGEMSLFLTAHYQAGQMASTVADVVARYTEPSASDIRSIFRVSSTVMGEDNFAANGYVVLSSVSRAANSTRTRVAWQCGGGGALVSQSRVGRVGGDAVLPGGLLLEADDNVIVAEVFYDYTPTLGFVPMPETVFYKTTVFRPRLGALTTPPGC